MIPASLPRAEFNLRMRQIFAMLDLDRDGEISFLDLSNCVNEIFYPAREFTTRRRQERSEFLLEPPEVVGGRAVPTRRRCIHIM